MNGDTGELFNSIDDAFKNALEKGMSETEANSVLMPLSNNEFNELQGMNRAQRRRWAKEHKKRANQKRSHNKE